MKNIFLEELGDAPILASLKGKQATEVPEFYFEELPIRVQERIALEDYLDIPSDYFETFAQKVNKKIQEEEEIPFSPVLDSLPKISPFAIPENYFEAMQEKVNEKVLAPTLFSLPKEENIQVPAAYFEQLPLQIEQKIGTAKVLSNFSFRKVALWTISTAAAIAMVFTFYPNPRATEKDMFAKVSDEALIQAVDVDDFDAYTLAEASGYTVSETKNEFSDTEIETLVEGLDESDILN